MKNSVVALPAFLVPFLVPLLAPLLAAVLLCASGPLAAKEKEKDGRLVCVDECRYQCVGSPRRQLYCQDTCVRRCLSREFAPRMAAPHF